MTIPPSACLSVPLVTVRLHAQARGTLVMAKGGVREGAAQVARRLPRPRSGGGPSMRHATPVPVEEPGKGEQPICPHRMHMSSQDAHVLTGCMF